MFRRIHAGGARGAARIEPGDRAKVIGRIVASAVLLLVGAYLCTREEQWAVAAGVGLLTLVAGYWIR